MVALDEVDPEQVGGADDDPVGRRVDLDDVAGLAVERRAVEAQPAALADREPVRPGVRADDRPRDRVDELPGPLPQPAVSHARVSPSGMKQMSWLSGLRATAKPRRAASSRTCGLVESPSGKNDRASWSASSTPSTYDWSLAGSTARCSSRPAGPSTTWA